MGFYKNGRPLPLEKGFSRNGKTYSFHPCDVVSDKSLLANTS